MLRGSLDWGVIKKKMHPPFFGLESRWGVSGDEEEGSHRMHVAQSWGGTRRGQVRDGGFTLLSEAALTRPAAFVKVRRTHAELPRPSLWP